MSHQVPWATEFEQLVRDTMTVHEAPGFAVAFAKDGKLVYANGFGFADREANEPVTPAHIFGIASITKSFTCLAILQLAEQGKLAVTDPIIKHLPEFRLPDERATRTATLANLMSHTAGLPPLPLLTWAIVPSQKDDPIMAQFADKIDPAGLPVCETVDDILAYLAKGEYQLTGQPGEMISYSNDGFGLLGEVINRVTGRSYKDYMREHIFAPLGLTSTTFDLDEARRLGPVVQLYARDKNDAVQPSPLWEQFEAMAACGGLRSTVLDLVRYGQMYLGGGAFEGKRIATRNSVEAMRQPRYFTARDTWYGYGLQTNPNYHGVTLVGHSGGLKGVTSYFGYVPEAGLTAAVITNLSGPPARRVWLNGINGMLGLPLTTQWTVEPEYELTQAEKERFVGTYPSGEGSKTRIALEGEQLVAYIGDKPFPLRGSAPDTVVYRVRDVDNAVRLISDANGNATGIHAGTRFIRKA